MLSFHIIYHFLKFPLTCFGIFEKFHEHFFLAAFTVELLCLYFLFLSLTLTFCGFLPQCFSAVRFLSEMNFPLPSAVKGGPGQPFYFSGSTAVSSGFSQMNNKVKTFQLFQSSLPCNFSPFIWIFVPCLCHSAQMFLSTRLCTRWRFVTLGVEKAQPTPTPSGCWIRAPSGLNVLFIEPAPGFSCSTQIGLLCPPVNTLVTL